MRDGGGVPLRSQVDDGNGKVIRHGASSRSSQEDKAEIQEASA